MFISLWLEDWKSFLSAFWFEMILYRNFVVFRRSRKSCTPKNKCLSFLSALFNLFSDRSPSSIYLSRKRIRSKEKEKAGIKGVVSSKALFCSSVRLWNVGVDVLCTKGQFTWSPFIASCISLRPGNRSSEYCSFNWSKLPFCFSCEISQKMDLNSDYGRKG